MVATVVIGAATVLATVGGGGVVGEGVVTGTVVAAAGRVLGFAFTACAVSVKPPTTDRPTAAVNRMAARSRAARMDGNTGVSLGVNCRRMAVTDHDGCRVGPRSRVGRGVRPLRRGLGIDRCIGLLDDGARAGSIHAARSRSIIQSYRALAVGEFEDAKRHADAALRDGLRINVSGAELIWRGQMLSLGLALGKAFEAGSPGGSDPVAGSALAGSLAAVALIVKANCRRHSRRCGKNRLGDSSASPTIFNGGARS